MPKLDIDKIPIDTHTGYPEPFRRVPGSSARLIEVEPGHSVEASAMPPFVKGGAARTREASLAGDS